MTSAVERRSSSPTEREILTSAIKMTIEETTLKDNNCSVLREKIYNKEILNSSNNFDNEVQQSSQSWVYYKNHDKSSMKNSHQAQDLEKKQNYNHNYNNSLVVQPEIKSNNFTFENEGRNFLKHIYNNEVYQKPFRIRSESEPSDIGNLRYIVLSSSNLNNRNDGSGDSVLFKKNSKIHRKNSDNEKKYFADKQQQKYMFTNKLPPKYFRNSSTNNQGTINGNNNKKWATQSSASYSRSIYKVQSHSPKLERKSYSSGVKNYQYHNQNIQQQEYLKTSLISNFADEINKNSPLIIDSTRRCRTKSPSPTYKKGKYNLNLNATSLVPFRKVKSVTPPPLLNKECLLPLSQSLPSSDKTFSFKNKTPLSSVPSLNCKINDKKSDKDNNNGNDSDDNHDDDDVDGDYTDDDDDNGDDDFEDNDDDDINSSSDSEDDYRSNAYLSSFEKSFSTLSFQLMQQKNEVSNMANFVPPLSPLVPSLFPNVPPFLAFSTHTDKGPQLPNQVNKILKWKLTTIMPKVVRRILINSGIRLLKKTNEWMGTWGKHMKSPCFRSIRSYQKVNHLPGSFKIGRKDSCWKNLKLQMAKHGRREFGFMPKTYIIPQDLRLLRKSWPKYAQKNFKWIIKPPASARGSGIKVVNRWSQIPKRKSIIVQRYIERPFLINDSKFDIRLYVLVTSINPLRVYLYHDGLVRFASVKYSDKSETLHDRCMHLTNYSINKFSTNYAKNEDVYACHGHKWTLKSLWKYFEKRGINTKRLWDAFRNLILRTLLAGENSINTMIKFNVESKYNCFELFGFDVLLDSELIPWLLEVNISPSLHSELPLDLHVKAPLVQAVLNTALYNIPPKLSADQQKELIKIYGLQGSLCYDKRIYITYLSRAEKLKHQQFTKKSLEDRDEYLNDILENLTPDDIRCLIISEDELSRSVPLERIFPTQYTYKYLKYTETPRYYNRLLDAWENRYGKNRQDGINLLKSLCEQKIHLETPQAPIKRGLHNDGKTKENTDK